MNTANSNSMRRSWYYWLTLVPLVLGASLALLKYAGWSAVYSGYYGLPSEAWRLKEAGPKAQLYWWVVSGHGSYGDNRGHHPHPAFQISDSPGWLEGAKPVCPRGGARCWFDLHRSLRTVGSWPLPEVGRRVWQAGRILLF
jgi:hypothetical protein